MEAVDESDLLIAPTVKIDFGMEVVDNIVIW